MSGILGGFGSSLIGGPGQSTSQSHTNATVESTNADRRLVVDSGSVGVSSDKSTINVTHTDLNAIERAFDLAKSSQVAVADGLERVVGLASGALKAQSAAGESIEAAYKDIGELTSGNRTLVTVALAVVAMVAGFQFFRKRQAA